MSNVTKEYSISDFLGMLRENVFSVTDYTRGKLGEVIKAFEEGNDEQFYFIRKEKDIPAAIIKFEELEELIKTREAVARAEEEYLLAEAIERADLPPKYSLDDVVEKLKLDPKRIEKLSEKVRVD